MRTQRTIFESGYDTAHLDGWRIRVAEEGGETVFRAVFVVKGADSPDVPPVELRRMHTANEAEVVRVGYLLVALVRYMNMGGSAVEAALSVREVLSHLGEVQHAGVELYAILRVKPPTVVWHDPARGEYLRVVEGDFSELLELDELEDLVGDSISASVLR